MVDRSPEFTRQDNDISKLSELRDKNGWEGVMVRSGEQSYEYKRTNNLLKIKKMQDSEFDIVGFFEGSGRLAGTLGGITIKLPTGEKVDVGSGYSDDDRKIIIRIIIYFINYSNDKKSTVEMIKTFKLI